MRLTLSGGDNIIYTASLKYCISFPGALYGDYQCDHCEEQSNKQEPNL